MFASNHPAYRSAAPQHKTSNSCNASFGTGSSGKTLLFGEILSEPQPIIASGSRTHNPQESNCRLILCASLNFTRMWEIDACRDGITDHLDPGSIASLRLVCHEMKNSVAPALFRDIDVTFNQHTFTKPRRLRALSRIGPHVQRMTFRAAHTAGTVLPPLLDDETGEQIPFVYKPMIRRLPRSKEPMEGKHVDEPKFGAEYGSTHINELLIRQYPPIFHAATNTGSFVRALEQMPHLNELRITCPGQEYGCRPGRNVIDYALISLRIAIEHCAPPCFERLSLLDVHWGAFQDLMPTLGLGSTPKSSRIWSRVKYLKMELTAPSEYDMQYSEHIRLLQGFIRTFAPSLKKFTFRWMHEAGPCPLEDISDFYATGHNVDVREHSSRRGHSRSGSSSSASSMESATSSSSSGRPKSRGPVHFPCLKRFELDNAKISASYMNKFIRRHRRPGTIFNLYDLTFRQGDWAEAFSEIERIARGEATWGDSVVNLPNIQGQNLPPPPPPPPQLLNRPIFSLASMDCPLFISPSARPLELPRLAPLDRKRPFFEPLVEDTLEPQPELKHVSMIQSALARIFERQPRHEHTTESLTAAAAATAHLRHQQEERERHVGHGGHLRQFIKNSLFHWR